MVCRLNLKLRVMINLIRVDKYLDIKILPPKRNLVLRFNGDVKWSPCEVVPWWSSGVIPNIRRGMYTHDGDINLLFILVVSTLVYFNACFLSHM